MTRTGTVVALALALGTPAAAQTDSIAVDPPDPRSTAPPLDHFAIGETLLFDGRFGLIPLGRASMQIIGVDTVRGEPAVHFRFRLNASLVGVVNIRDRFDSWVGVDDFVSRRFTQDFDEMGKKRQTRYEIFPDSGVYYEAGVDSAKTASANPLDDTAFFYWVRTLTLAPGERHEFDNYFRPDRNPVVIEVVGRDTIDVPAGRFATVVIRPIIKGGMFGDNRNGRVWISDDPRRLIVQMKTSFGFGAITLRLTEVIQPDSTALPATRGGDTRGRRDQPGL